MIEPERTHSVRGAAQRANIGRYLNTWNVILVLVFIVLFFAVLYPVLYIFKASFMDPETGAFSLNSYQTFFKYPYYLRCLRNSLFVSALATGFALAIGIPFAFFLPLRPARKDIIKPGNPAADPADLHRGRGQIMLQGRNGYGQHPGPLRPGRRRSTAGRASSLHPAVSSF